MRLFRALVLLVACGFAAVAAAQVNLPGAPLPRLPAVGDPLDQTLRAAQQLPLTELRQLRIRELLRQDRARFEAGPGGHPVMRGEVVALAPSPGALARALTADFAVTRDATLDALGLRIVVLRAPPGMSTRRALRRLRSLDPGGSYDYNHVYVGGGATLEPATATAPAPQAPRVEAAGRRLGLVDSGVDGAHPALAGIQIHRFGCDGKVLPSEHGTAVASLLAGEHDGFRGALPGATLYAADIFCGGGGGNLGLLALALDWMARERVPVVNISLVGAKSLLLNGLVRAMDERGYLLVAAVGNDGPAAPPLYPAAYPEVIGVTAVDARDRALPEACRGRHVAFAAPGADMLAAVPGGGVAPVRGTSFASPIVAGLLAAHLDAPDPLLARAARERLAATAVDLGAPGVDPVYGEGLVGAMLRNPAPADGDR